MNIQKAISQDLFKKVKPICVKILELSESNGSELIPTIYKLSSTLATHETEAVGLYTITTNLSDYIFFPLSKLLGKQELDPQIVRHLFDIVEYLIRCSWVPNDTFTNELVLQLLPIILYLIKTNSNLTNPDFKISTIKLIHTMLPHMDIFKTQDLKALSLLGDLTNILIDNLKTFTDSSQEGIELMILNLDSIHLLLKTMTSDQVSRIFPGLVSSLINFSLKPLHFTVTCKVLDIIQSLVAIVFDQSSLSIKIEDIPVDLNELLTNDTSTNTELNVSFTMSSADFRNRSWLLATSKQFKVILSTFITKTFEKHTIKSQIIDGLLSLVRTSMSKCYWSLFDLLPLWIDTICLCCYSRIYSNTGKLDLIEEVFVYNEIFVYFNEALQDFNTKKSHQLLVWKIEDLITKLPNIMRSTNEDRILKYYVSLKFHLFLLSKHQNGSDDLPSLISQAVIMLDQSLVENSGKRLEKPDKSEFLINYQGKNVFDNKDDENKLDNIQLPPYVNASNLTKFTAQQSQGTRTSNLLILSNQWSETSDWTVPSNGGEPVSFFSSFPNSVEIEIQGFLHFCHRFEFDKLALMESILNDSDIATKGISLWICNQLIKKEENLDFNEFLDFGEDELDGSPDNEEMVYLLVDEAQQLIENIQPQLESLALITTNKAHQAKNQISQQSYAIALTTIGQLSKVLPKAEFRTSFLVNYLFPLFESLTYSSVQEYGKSALISIAHNYYNDSIQDLIIDNSNYLVDSLSLKLSMPSSLTPSLSGILVIILKVAGDKLIRTNQLSDIISQMFILIDSYHGYSILIEGFFIVFKELVNKIKSTYLNDHKFIENDVSLYKPWGMTSLTQFNDLLEESKKLVEPFEDYDREKEYFKSPNVPFKEQEQDSDDEDEEQEPESTKEEEWVSCIPKDSYFQVQKIFIYGLRLISHPSDSLKIQILTTLIDIYPLLSTNYSLLLPIVSSNWSDIVLLLSNDNVCLVTMELLITMIDMDKNQNELFLSRKFIEVFNYVYKSGSELIKFKNTNNVKYLDLLSKFFIKGLNNYERIIPDTVGLKIMKMVLVLGKPDIDFGKQARNLEWVTKRRLRKEPGLLTA